MIGTFLLNTCPDTTSIISDSFDFIIIDREHGRPSLDQTLYLLLACQNRSKKFVRVSSCNKIEIQKVLELNPDGILIPHVDSVESAKKAIMYSRFNPLGERGLSPYTRAFGFSEQEYEEKKKNLNKKVKLGLLIEGKQGFDSLEIILEEFSEEIEFIYFGLYDFSNSSGINADWKNQILINSLREIIKICENYNTAVGTIARNIEEYKLLEKERVKYIVYKNDLGVIHDTFGWLSKQTKT